MADMFQTKNIRKLNADLSEISRELIEKSGKRIKTEVGDTLLTGANDTRNDIIKSMRNTPRLKRQWTNWPNEAREKRRHYPSKPGHPPAIDKGDMVKSIQFDSYDYKFIIGSTQLDPPYPEWLEDPTENAPKAPYEARPWLEPASKRQEPIIIENLGKIIPDITDKIFRNRI